MTSSVINTDARDPLAIEVRVERVSALFDALDPFPLPSRDLAPAAEEFVVGWARELSPHAPLSIVVHTPETSAEADLEGKLQDAFQRHFAYRAERLTSDLHELFRIGRLSLLIGVTVLAACVVLGGLLQTHLRETYTARFFSEGLIILGWVANWRPIEIFLYDWWPLVNRRRLIRRLAATPVHLKHVPHA
jgi:hypothetical protein